MKRNKRGISLIVLVITIIVMLILAAAVIISIERNKIIDRADEAVDETNLKEIQTLATVIWADAYLDKVSPLDEEYIKGKLEEENINTDDLDIIVTDNGVSVSKKIIGLSETRIDLNKGATETLTVTYNKHEGATITWASSDTSIATVDSNGVVTGVAGGTVTITANQSSTGGSARCKVNVKDVNIEQTSVTINKSAAASLTLKDYKPSGAIIWTSSNTSVATVDGNGVVTGAGAGTTTITATHSESGLSDTCMITVVEIVNKQELDITQTSVDIYKNATTTLALSANSPTIDITWTSSDQSVATVSSSGVVTGVAGGTATITATHAASGLKDTCKINVYEVNIAQKSVDVNKGATTTLTQIGYAPRNNKMDK